MLDLIFPSIYSVISLTAIGILFGLVLSFAKLKLKIEKDPRFEKILELLPNANCGACGQPGCSGYASRIVDGNIEINLCPVSSDEVIEKIADIMGVTAEAKAPRKARIHCQGGIVITGTRFIYTGPRSCTAAQQVMDGFKICQYGCLGLGDCKRSCPFNAIQFNEIGLPVVNWEKCTGCGNCVEACPRNITGLVEERFGVYVMCKNEEKASVMKKGCPVGCIGCKRCVKTCKEVFADNPDIETAIDVINFVARIDYELCINCLKCAESCPVPVVHPISRAQKKKAPAQVEAEV
jgi:electron transport complex protein RnfB